MGERDIDFRDLDFDHEFRSIRLPSGKLGYRWTPIGMPRIPRKFERCVFFLYGLNPETGVMEGPYATGFFVARVSKTLFGQYHVYAVSNRHTVNPWSCPRIYTRNDCNRLIDLDPAEWVVSKASDVAVSDVTDLVNIEFRDTDWGDSISWIDERRFLTKDEIQLHNIGIGDETIMVVLFANHHDESKNIPVAGSEI